MHIGQWGVWRDARSVKFKRVKMSIILNNFFEMHLKEKNDGPLRNHVEIARNKRKSEGKVKGNLRDELSVSCGFSLEMKKTLYFIQNLMQYIYASYGSRN